MKKPMEFTRIKDAQGLPADYVKKDHHKVGYTAFIAKRFRRRILDDNGHFHGLLNIRVKT